MTTYNWTIANLENIEQQQSDLELLEARVAQLEGGAA